MNQCRHRPAPVAFSFPSYYREPETRTENQVSRGRRAGRGAKAGPRAGRAGDVRKADNVGVLLAKPPRVTWHPATCDRPGPPGHRRTHTHTRACTPGLQRPRRCASLGREPPARHLDAWAAAACAAPSGPVPLLQPRRVAQPVDGSESVTPRCQAESRGPSGGGLAGRRRTDPALPRAPRPPRPARPRPGSASKG